MVRVWLPDRPGALGAVASRIGAVRGDVVGIEILERGGGRAVDDLVVQLPDDGLVDLLVAEMIQVDGVDVEDVRPLADAMKGEDGEIVAVWHGDVAYEGGDLAVAGGRHRLAMIDGGWRYERVNPAPPARSPTC